MLRFNWYYYIFIFFFPFSIRYGWCFSLHFILLLNKFCVESQFRGIPSAVSQSDLIIAICVVSAKMYRYVPKRWTGWLVRYNQLFKTRKNVALILLPSMYGKLYRLYTLFLLVYFAKGKYLTKWFMKSVS